MSFSLIKNCMTFRGNIGPVSSNKSISWCVYVHSWQSLGCSAAVLERSHLNFVSHIVDTACIASDHRKLVAKENCN